MSVKTMGLLSREYTRRQFMAMTAKGLAGVALSGSMLGLLGVTQAQATAGVVTTVALSHGLLVVNKAKCTGCMRCEANCTLVNRGEVHPYVARLHMSENRDFGQAGPKADYRYGEGFFGNWSCGPDTCRQCEDAACMNICPVKAIYVSETNGARIVDEDKCVGCGACQIACPFGMARVDPDDRKSQKCINCGFCAMNCPTSALKIVPWDAVAAAM